MRSYLIQNESILISLLDTIVRITTQCMGVNIALKMVNKIKKEITIVDAKTPKFKRMHYGLTFFVLCLFLLVEVFLVPFKIVICRNKS